MTDVTRTFNDIEVGQRVVYETAEDPNSGRVHFIEGVVTRIVSDRRVAIRNSPGTDVEIEVDAEFCERAYDCELCKDTGVVEHDARVAWNATSGVYIEGPDSMQCICQENNNE